jgi:hypothetical protein
MSLWMVLIALVVALNLRLIAPAMLAFLGIWSPPASSDSNPHALIT